MLKDKIAVVTGGTRGIGYAIVKKYLENGAKVILFGSRPETVEKALSSLKSENPSWPVEGFHPNLSDAKEVAKTIEGINEKYGRIDILVNNAHASTQKPLEALTEDDFALSFNTGFWGTHYFMQAVFPIFKAKKAGKIINFGSNSSILGHAYQGAYAAAKEAIGAITKVAATEWGVYNINVNILCPFANSPGMIAWSENFPEEYDKTISRIPLRRVGDCQNDIGEVASWLASHEADYVTGQTILVDGGAHYIR